MQKLLTLTLAAFLLSAVICSGQQIKESRDSIPSSFVTADFATKNDPGSFIFAPDSYSTMVSSTGNTDVIKYIQTIPGVSSGAEGSSAIYVRGGNMGNNIQTLDGVPIYGFSHLLGLTTVYSQDIISDVQFKSGGFDSDEGDITSSRIDIKTADGDYHSFINTISLSNLFVGTMISTPIIKDKLSLLVSARVSPIKHEISAIKSLTPAMDSIDNIGSTVFDSFIKLSYKGNRRNRLSMSWFNSLDSYGYSYGTSSEDVMRWSNSIITIQDHFKMSNNWSLLAQLSFNHFSNFQRMKKIIYGSDNDLSISNDVSESIAHLQLTGHIFHIFDYTGGLKFRGGQLVPATTSFYYSNAVKNDQKPSYDDVYHSTIATVNSQIEYNDKDHLYLRLSGRSNKYFSKYNRGNQSYSRPIDLEGSVVSRVKLSGNSGIEGTIDWTKQYYHLLEGLPLGWNLDIMIPSLNICPPEAARQLYLGWFDEVGSHKVSVGAYTKDMKNVLYFPDAKLLFSSAAAGWSQGLKNGEGYSKGIEVKYDYDGSKIDVSLSYTLSKTDRLFESINSGKSFHATNDRRHILNILTDYVIASNNNRKIGVTGLITYQSGSWTTMPSGHYYYSLPPYGTTQDIKYYSGVNNWQLPPYFRVDIGFYLRHGIDGKHPGQLNVGIYNILNNHNPYGMTYDTESRTWKQISLFPIMPSLSWNVRLF